MNKEEVKQLIAERDKIDSQLSELHDILKMNDVDMETPLVDHEGFPIAELDIVQIRKTRHSIICLTNDRKKLTGNIEEMLVKLHASVRKNAEPILQDEVVEADEIKENSAPKVHRTSNKPFLRVENVVYGSPAFYAGLLNDDIVVQCGPLHADNFDGLQKLSELIAEHKSITLTVLRGTTVHHVTVHPGKWDGAGIFGARLQIIHAEEKE